MIDLEQPEQALHTVRDWLRYAVSRFNAAGLTYGHGTANAFDEAAFLILHTLKLPIHQLDPWLDAKLLVSERKALAEIIEKRISTRKPAPYLTNEAWAGGHAFYVDERVIVPRSYIAELLAGGLGNALPDLAEPRRLLDLCTARDAWPSWRRWLSMTQASMRQSCRPAHWRWLSATYRPMAWRSA